jgi:ubiquinone/menaquinone biosynthesis C-methylase UbiE
MAYLDFLSSVHKSTKRDYRQRVLDHDKAECAELACQFGRDYWDGERHLGYGGYRYDGRWRPVAEEIARHYDLKPGSTILDVGCGKAFLLYEFTQVVPGAKVVGLDLSSYAIENAKEEVRPYLQIGNAASLPFPDKSFDLVFSLNVLHNLYHYDLWAALQEMERVGRGGKYLVVETYRNEREKVNLLYWQLTCRAFHTPQEWEWLYKQAGYTGDHGYITFE